MTEKLFWRDPYQARLDTVLTGVDGDDVTVRETIFYALSGGQESDSGTIGTSRVTHARKDGKEIIYTVESGHEFQAGQPVSMIIDWERRYRLMRLHFAAEIILELAYRHTNSAEKIGAHIAADKARIDFQWDRNISALFPAIQAEASRLIEDDHAITSAFSDEAEQRRYWEIPGFARVPCGGTHLRTTGEVGPLELRRKNIGKGKERIEIYVRDASA